MKEKIKILYIVNHTVLYGANVALLNIIDELTNLNIESMVIVGCSGSLCDELDARNIHYETINHEFQIYPRIQSLRNVLTFLYRLLKILLINFVAEKRLYDIVKDFQPDLIHTNIGPTHIGFNVAKKLGIPHVWHIREYQDLDFGMIPFPSKKRFKNKLNDCNNHAIAITKGIFYHFDMNINSRVIYDGVLNENNIKFIEQKGSYFLFLGRLEETKGIRHLLHAFIEFASFNDEFELLIAGDGSAVFVDELKVIANKSVCFNRIHFLGFRNDVSELLSKASALIVPSIHEGFGFITVEAMFNGCLVVGNNAGGTKEILETENLGILYFGHEDLVSALKDIVTFGIEKYFPIIKKAQIIASKLYSRERNAHEIFNLYKEILNR